MNALELLLSKRFIIKEENKELYYKVKDGMGDFKKFITEKLGYQIISNQYLIRMEKIPAKAENWMGINGFAKPVEYAYLCMVLMFLEDKDVREQFVLSQLTEYLQVNYKCETIDWTQYNTRRHLIRVMKFCLEHGMIKIRDGSEENFAYDALGDVLYENTGVSRYFMKNFTRDISEYTKIEDFEENEWIGLAEDRGVVRRQRVYRSLLMSPGMYKKGEGDEDFAYVKNYRNMIEDDFGKLFHCELQVHRNSVYLILDEDSGLGKGFPAENTLSDCILLCNSILVDKINRNEIAVPADEKIVLDEAYFQSIMEECKERYGSGMIKAYREMTTGEFVKTVREYLEELEWIETDAGSHRVTIRPIMGKLIGRYPENFNRQEESLKE